MVATHPWLLVVHVYCCVSRRWRTGTFSMSVTSNPSVGSRAASLARLLATSPSASARSWALVTSRNGCCLLECSSFVVVLAGHTQRPGLQDKKQTCTDVSCALVHHSGCVPRSEDPARDLNNEIAELEARVAHPMHWTNGEHQLNLTRLQQLIYEKQRRDKASASGNSPA